MDTCLLLDIIYINVDRLHVFFPQKKRSWSNREAAGGPGVVSTFYLSNNGGLYDKHLGCGHRRQALFSSIKMVMTWWFIIGFTTCLYIFQVEYG